MAINVIFYGLGPIGAAVARQVATRKGFRIVGGIDVDPAKIGRDLGDVIGFGKKLRVRVTNDAAGALKATKPDVVVLCTSSSLKKVMPQIAAVLKARVPIVSTTEELSYPVGKNRSLAKQIDAMAKKAKVAVLGTGVNPGFTMDALPIMLTGVCERVDSIRVDRVQDARSRRLPFQQKIGSGLTEEQFQRKVADGSVRHVGLAESVMMIADALGWRLEKVTDEIRPQIADATVESDTSRLMQATSAASFRTASGGGTASRSLPCTWKRTSARRRASMRSPSRATRAFSRRSAAACTETWRRRRLP